MKHDRTELDTLRRDRAALEAEILAAGSTVKGKTCNCPSPDHDDAHPSAGLYERSDGAQAVHCHSCGYDADVIDLMAANRGCSPDDILRELRGSNSPKQIKTKGPDMFALAKRFHEAITDERLAWLADDLGLSAQSLRRLRVGWATAAELREANTKCSGEGCYTFPMRRADGQIVGIRLRTPGGFKYAVDGGKGGLFIMAELTGSGPLVLCEGATDCPTGSDMGFDSIGRSNNCSSSDEQEIFDYIKSHPRREVWIVRHADAKGTKAGEATERGAERLAAKLAPVVDTVKVLSPPKPFKDLRAWRQSGAGYDDLDAVASEVTARNPAGELRDLYTAIADGRNAAIHWPWRLVTRGTQALIPGGITVIVGDPGSGKSLWLLEAMAFWHDAGLPVSVYELELARRDHLMRAMAQRVGASWLTDRDIIKQRGSEADAYCAEHETWLNGIGKQITDAPDKPVSLDDLIEWVNERAVAGSRVIAIDPITAADTTDRPWDDANKFLNTVRPVLNRYGASLVLVTHPRGGKTSRTAATLDDLAGGKAWARFTDTVLWVERHDEPKTVTVKGFADAFPLPQVEEINRTLRVMKARNGRGAGWQIAFDFDPQTLRFNERGAIVKQTTTVDA